MLISDSRERNRVFNELQREARQADTLGHFEGLPFDISHYIDGMQPAHVNIAGSLVLPADYDPLDGPPTLMLLPGETKTIKFKPWTQAEKRAVGYIAAQAGIMNLTIDGFDSTFKRTLATKDQGGGVVCNAFSPESSSFSYKKYPLSMPRLMTISAEHADLPSERVRTLAHELDHWDMGLHSEAGIHKAAINYPDHSWLQAYAEKRGYRTSYMIDCNTGAQTVTSTIEELAEPYKRFYPSAIKNIRDALISRQQRAGAQHADTMAPVVLVAEHLYQDPKVAVTSNELDALMLLGVVRN